MTSGGPLQLARLCVGARLFGLAVLSAPVLVSRDSTALLAVLAVGVIWATATAALRLRLRVNPSVALTVEAALVGAVCALALDASTAVLVALAVPPFTAGLGRGLLGVALSLSAELITLVAISAAVSGRMDADQGTGTFTWVVAGLGLGLIGTFLHTTATTPHDPLTPYRDAQALIHELIDLSGGLSSGLDPVPLGGTIAALVRDELPVTALAVQVPRGDELTPLVTEAEGSDAALLDELALAAWRAEKRTSHGAAFAFPLMTDAGPVAVVAGLLSPGLDPGNLDLDSRLAGLADRLEPSTVHLDTALLFGAFRDAATAGERRRLAREMHDGIAQDIASLGYLVDQLVARADAPDQAARLQQLRERISVVVADVRASVQTMRTDVGSSASLGTAIGALARNLSESTGVPIHVTADERATRLRPEVEAELLRIAQEAMTNAVRHSQPSRVEVHCRVEAPGAEIVVRDDGVGLQPRRRHSQGIEIMQERAHLVDAELTLSAVQPHGTMVRVQVPVPRTRNPDE